MSTGRELHKTTSNSQINDMYETTQNLINGFLYQQCTDRCITNPNGHGLNTPEKKC